MRASEERWRSLFETSAAGVGLFRLDGVCIAVNPALQQMLDRTKKDIVGRNVLELNHEDERRATPALRASGLFRPRRRGSEGWLLDDHRVTTIGTFPWRRVILTATTSP